MFNNVSTLFKVASLTQTVRELIDFTEIGKVNDELEAFNSAVSEMNVND